jgi:hypothetical protein
MISRGNSLLSPKKIIARTLNFYTLQSSDFYVRRIAFNLSTVVDCNIYICDVFLVLICCTVPVVGRNLSTCQVVSGLNFSNL